MKRKFKRIMSEDKEWIGGVCAGMAYCFGIPTWLVRLGWACLVIFVGIGVIPYILLWIFMPTWENMPDDYEEIAE